MKKDIPEKDLDILISTIKAAKIQCEFDPVLFVFPEPNDMPSEAQVTFSKEILDDWLENDVVTVGYERYIAGALSFMHFSFDTLAYYLSEDKAANIKYIKEEYDVDWSKEYADTILKYSKIYHDVAKGQDEWL